MHNISQLLFNVLRFFVQNDNFELFFFVGFVFLRHGTRCAGEVAASANNSICSVGVAWDAGIGGMYIHLSKELKGQCTISAKVLKYKLKNISVNLRSSLQ